MPEGRVSKKMRASEDPGLWFKSPVLLVSSRHGTLSESWRGWCFGNSPLCSESAGDLY